MTFSSSATAPSDLRVLTSLLATADPTGRVAAGAPPTVYADTAELALEALRAGEDTVMVMLTLPTDTPVENALRFARTAQNWWDERRAADAKVLLGA